MKKRSNYDNGGNGLVIVLDDEPLILQMTKTILEREGYSVETAGTVEAAKDVICKHGCYTRAFILDCGLSRKSNAKDSILSCIASYAPSRPVLLISGDWIPVEENFISQEHNSAFVQKPFKIDELLSALSTLLAQTDNVTHTPRFHPEKSLKAV